MKEYCENTIVFCPTCRDFYITLDYRHVYTGSLIYRLKILNNDYFC
jgi:hypothetical protein